MASVVDGHLRLKAARKLGLTEVAVALADELADAQIKAFRLPFSWEQGSKSFLCNSIEKDFGDAAHRIRPLVDAHRKEG